MYRNNGCYTVECDDDIQDASVQPWGGLTTTRDGVLTFLDCYATTDKLDQPHTQSDCNTETVESDTCGVKSFEAEDTNPVHATHDVKPEQIGEQDTNDLDTNQHEMSMESELPLDNAIQEKHKAYEYVTNGAVVQGFILRCVFYGIL